MSAISQSSTLLSQIQDPNRGRCYLPRSVAYLATSTDSTSVCFLKTRLGCRLLPVTSSALRQQQASATWAIKASVTPDSTVPIVATVNSASEEPDIEPDTSDGGGNSGRASGGSESGGGGNNWGSNNEGEGESDKSGDNNKKMAMSMSQKLTLGYAALVGFGGVMGYVKSGSQKSLVSGGLSALILYFVYSQLPTNPVFASSIGFGISAALLGVMGSRFKKSGKVFPAGVVSVVSFVMTGGYLHGIMRGIH